MAEIIVLNGTSSSGKSSVARALQEHSSETLLYFSIDTILYTLPPATLQRIMTGEPVPQVRFRDVVAGYYACVRELANAGNRLVIDNAITSRAHGEMLLEAVRGHDAIVVRIHCSRETLLRRERERGDRRPGLASSQLVAIDTWVSYDLEIDTDVTAPADAAATILAVGAGRERRGISETAARLHRA